MDIPETRYARSGDVNIAYQVLGTGPFDLVFVPGFVSNVELSWRVPQMASFFRRLAGFCRLIRFDKRGTGMSDRVSGMPDLETRMDDVRAVMDAAGSKRAALLGASEGGTMSLLFAATYPQRAWALVLWSTFPRERWAPDYPFGDSDEELERESRADLDAWADPDRMAKVIEGLAPSLDVGSKRALASYLRQSASPGAVLALRRMNAEIDVRQVLPAIRVPTLALYRAGHPRAMAGARYIAEHVAGARLVELPGKDLAIPVGDNEPVLEEIERFLSAAGEAEELDEAESDRVLATVMFTDIVGSTAKAAELGDRAWRELLEQHNAVIRRQLVRFRGRELDTAGDGFFASFDGPARAIRCARAIVDSFGDFDIDVRAGLHTGECEVFENKIGGIAVATGARVAAHARPGEVLVSSTVKDLVAGSGIGFNDRGLAELKGVPGEWRLFAVAPG